MVFSYLPEKVNIRYQQLNKRFYNTFVPSLVKTVTLFQIGNVGQGVMVFPGQEAYVNVLDFSQSLSWQKKYITYFDTQKAVAAR